MSLEGDIRKRRQRAATKGRQRAPGSKLAQIESLVKDAKAAGFEATRTGGRLLDPSAIVWTLKRPDYKPTKHRVMKVWADGTGENIFGDDFSNVAAIRKALGLTRKPKAKAKAKIKCGPRRGALTTTKRNALPDSAFGLPELRKYPLYDFVAGQAVPDREHAINAKARATQELEKGNLTLAQKAKIDKRANAVMRKCPLANHSLRLLYDDGHVKYMTGARTMAAAKASMERAVVMTSPISGMAPMVVEIWHKGRLIVRRVHSDAKGKR